MLLSSDIARKFAGLNFSEKELGQGVVYAHRRGVHDEPRKQRQRKPSSGGMAKYHGGPLQWHGRTDHSARRPLES